ncbi:MAG: glycosyltransferase family 2 protein [Candidatus Helarchaeota archaeon]
MVIKDKHPLLSIIILTNPFRSVQLTMDCIQSISKQDYSEIELIVVDNNSKEEDIEKLDNYLNKIKNQFKNVVFIKNKKNYGYSKGNNIGILRSKGDIISIMNNDIELEEDLIIKCVSILNSQKDIGITCPKIVYYSHPDIIWYAGGYINPKHNLVAFHRGVKEKDLNQYNKIEEIDYANGSCMFIKREVLKKIGLFDQFYFLYYEEVDLNYRAKSIGYKIYYVGNTKMFHKVTPSTISPFQVYLYTRNRYIFSLKNLGVKDVLLFLITQIKTFFIEFLKYFPNRSKNKSHIKGILDGLKFGIKKRKKSNIIRI